MQNYFNEGVGHDIDDIKINFADHCTRFEELLTILFRPLSRYYLYHLISNGNFIGNVMSLYYNYFQGN